MCGIAGIVSSDRTERIEEALVHQMCEAIVHRGPDDEGLLARQNTGLGLRRLSIIDLSGGHQPVFNEDRTAWIVFSYGAECEDVSAGRALSALLASCSISPWAASRRSRQNR